MVDDDRLQRDPEDHQDQGRQPAPQGDVTAVIAGNRMQVGGAAGDRRERPRPAQMVADRGKRQQHCNDHNE